MGKTTPKLIIRYSCFLCGLTRVPCEVEERGKDEEVKTWMTSTAMQVQKDHLRRSPDCSASKISELLIPVAGASRIGEIARS